MTELPGFSEEITIQPLGRYYRDGPAWSDWRPPPVLLCGVNTCLDGQICVKTTHGQWPSTITDYSCACPADSAGNQMVVCGNQCVSISSDVNHCGTCGDVCRTGEACCGSICTDIANDPANCGNCGTHCAYVPGTGMVEGRVCQNGRCGCPVGQSICSEMTLEFVASYGLPQVVDTTRNFCTDLTRDSGNCGACGTKCPPNYVCQNGSCVCPHTFCGNMCVNLDTDPNNCGACGIAVPHGGACVAGKPACPPGRSFCPSWYAGGSCVDTATDSRNCGLCGEQCADECCSGICVDRRSDPNNCYYCGHQCPTYQAGPLGIQADCTAGQCVCPGAPPTGSSSNGTVNYDFFNGCEDILGLKVSLHVTQDLVAAVTPSGGGTPTPDGGFALQLNAFGPSGPAGPPYTANWMQYMLLVSGNAISGQVQYWDLGSTAGGPFPDPDPFKLYPVVSLPSNSSTVPAGFVLEIELTNDSTGNVTGVNFRVTDNAGNTSATAVPFDAGAQFRPIEVFEVNVVGPNGCQNATFSSGEGTITYAVSSGQLCVTPPGNPCSLQLTSVCETSNISYGLINLPCCGSPITQSFSTG